MGALPKRKISTSRQGKRRGTIKLKPPTLTLCPDCHRPKRPHHVCSRCGSWRQEKILRSKEKDKTKSR